MRCQHARDLISLSLDVPMPEYERTRLADHLGGCADCRRHQEVLEEGRERMQKGMAHVPENFEWKVQLGIQRALRQRAAEAETPAKRAAFWKPMLGSAAAVAAAVVLVGSFFLLPEAEQGPAGGDSSEFVSPLAQDVPAQPDLSGAVRGPDLDFDMSDSRFGIRTVGGTVPPQFQEDLRARTNPGARLWSSEPGAATPGLVGDAGLPSPRLHLFIRRYTLRDVSPAPADTSAREVSEIPASPR